MENEEVKDEVIVDIDTIAEEAPVEISPEIEAVEEEIIAE